MIGWQIKAIAAAVLIAGVGGLLWHDHYLAGRLKAEKREKGELIAKYEAKLETQRLQARADIAQQVHYDEVQQVDTVTRADPLHGSLCDRSAAVRQAAPGNPIDAGPSAAASDFLAMPERDRSGDEGQPDQLGMLDLLARRADFLSAQLREWQGR